MGRTRQVMIIDEDPAFRAEVTAMLKSAPVAVVADSGYGVEASSLAEETRPDLIVAAVEPPLARAAQTIQAVRHLLPDRPIIVYSSVTDMNALRPILQAGVRDFLPRPLRPPDLLRAIGQALSQSDADGGAAAKSGAGSVLAIVGAKGGVGKSTVATNLAAAIAQDTDQDVLIMDLDQRFGDVAIMLDVEPHFTIADLVGSVPHLDRQTFRSALLSHPSGVKILPAPRHPGDWRAIQGAEVQALITLAARLFDYVILDTPGTFNDIVAAALNTAGDVLVVSSLDLASIKDTALMWDLLTAEGYAAGSLRLVVNDATNARLIRPADIQKALERRIWCHIPHDAQVLRAAQLGQPVVLAKPKCRAARRIREMAAAITGAAEVTHPPASRRRLTRLLPFPHRGRRRRSLTAA